MTLDCQFLAFWSGSRKCLGSQENVSCDVSSVLVVSENGSSLAQAFGLQVISRCSVITLIGLLVISRCSVITPLPGFSLTPVIEEKIFLFSGQVLD